MCPYAATYISSICNDIVRAEFKNPFQILLKNRVNSQLLHFCFVPPCLFFSLKPFIINNSSLNGLEASGVSISSAESSVVFVFSFGFIISPPVSPLFPTLDAYSLLKALRISVHCFWKFWVRSSANKLHKCAWFPTPGYNTCFPRVREVTTLILSLCGDIVLPGRSVLLSHHLTRLYSPPAPGPA